MYQVVLLLVFRNSIMILSCQNISKTFVDQEVIKNASFLIEAHEKTALVGINGAGKSTLLKIITGELSADEGQVIIPRGISVGYLAQQQMLSGHQTIIEELREAKAEVIKAEETLRSLEKDMRHLSGQQLAAVMGQYHQLNEWFERHEGYAVQSEITGVLKGLGFTEEDASRNCDTLSGGQKTRIALGKLLLSSPDLLLLDEPTNHLDIRSIEWLEGYLKNYSGAVLIVSHDRYFLNRIVTKVIEIDRTKVTTYPGDYTAYSRQKKLLRDAALKAWAKQQEQIHHQEQVIEKLRSFNREKSIKRAESREKMLDKIQRLEKPSEANSQINLTLTPSVISGREVLDVEHLSKSFPPLRLFEDLSMRIRRGERVALIGDNGTGKTTLLKIINGIIEADEGTVSFGTRVMIGYYDQDHQVLHSEKTLFDELSDSRPDMNNTQIRNVLAAFLFTGDDVFKRICDLSGGERGRVSLAKLMLSGANFLILDEPTNHLDIQSKEILEDALRMYTGTVLFVSHDRYFVNQACTRIVELTNTRLVNYLGNYDYYLEKHEELTQIYAPEEELTLAASDKNSSGESAKEAWQRAKEAQAQARKRQNDLKKTEDEIARCEEEDRRIDLELTREDVYSDIEKVTQLTERKAELQETLRELYEVWEQLAEEI